MSSREFSVAFGALLVLIAVLLFAGITAAPSARAGARRIVDTSGAAHVYHVDTWKGVVVSFLVGILSSVFGIGGGIIQVLFLIVVLSLPVHIAMATSHFVLSISTLVGAATFFALGHVDLTTTADRKSTRLNSSHITISYAVFCLKKKKKILSLQAQEFPEPS